MAKAATKKALAPPAQDLTGSAVGRFTIQRLLGTGGMGQVYQADDTRLKRPVALKRMAPQLNTDEHYRRRFLKEAECASRLAHQNIAAVYDFFEEHGETFLVMEYVRGETLRDRLCRPISINELIEVFIQSASALVAAHGQGIVHRDIKPENIMLTPTSEVKVLDFGVAKILPRADESTTQLGSDSTGGMAGTPSYMAPEMLLEKKADARSDMFSLGTTLYEALTGQHPFLSDTFLHTADRILHHTPPLPHLVSAKVPAELSRITNKLISKDPAERYATSADLLVDLRAAQRATAYPVLTPPQGAFLQPNPAGPARSLSSASTVADLQQPSSHRGLWLVLLLVAVLCGGTALYWPRIKQILPNAIWRTASTEQSNSASVPGTPAPPVSAAPAASPGLAATDANSDSPLPPAIPPEKNSAPNKPSSPKSNSSSSASAEGEPLDDKAHTTPGKGEIEMLPDVDGANVLLHAPDGTTQSCVTPCSFRDLRPGRYTAEITKDGYRELLGIYPVEANRILQKKDHLDLQQGTINVQSLPPQAEVYVNGNRQPGLTPMTIPLPPGQYSVVVQMAGYQPARWDLTLKDQQNHMLTAKFEADSAPPQGVGRVEIRTVPPGADILVDGASTGHRTPFTLELPPGGHKLTLYMQGYTPLNEVVVADPGKPLQIERVLRKP
ncbi:MAG: protein kinase domain-containing protein [Candidatus Acidiferrales bacterium]